MEWPTYTTIVIWARLYSELQLLVILICMLGIRFASHDNLIKSG